MKNLIPFIFLLMMLMMSSCELVGDIFSAGFYAGIFLVVLVIVVIVYIVIRMGRRG